MPSIRVKENEPFEVAMRRFKRAIEKTGLLTELRAREAYEKPTQKSCCCETPAKTPAQPNTATKNVLIYRQRPTACSKSGQAVLFYRFKKQPALPFPKVQAAFSAFLAIQDGYIRHNGGTHGGLRVKTDAQTGGICHVDGFQLRQQFVAVAEEKADEVGGGNKGGEG